MDEKLLVRIHFASGKTIQTTIDHEGADSADFEAEDWIENAIKGAPELPSKPRWTWIGDVYLYTQTIEGIEIL